jgi:hypothetical protein
MGIVSERRTGMARYLVLWTIDAGRVPLDHKERANGWLMLMNLIRQDFEKGILKDWGSFPGEAHGYSVMEGSIIDINLALNQYIPFVSFEIHPAATINEIEKFIKVMAGQEAMEPVGS